MKMLNLLSLITSIMCVLISIIQTDWTEAMAWGIVTIYTGKELFIND